MSSATDGSSALPLSLPLAQGRKTMYHLIRLPTSLFSTSQAPASSGEDDEGAPKDLSSSSDTSSSSASTTTMSATFSLMKALVGTGMLALPSGLAAISDFPHMLWSANALMLLLGVLSAYTFWICGRLAHATGGQSLSDVWLKIYPQSSGRIVSWSNLIYCLGCCLTYSLVLGDSLSSLLRGIFPAAASSWIMSRHAVILAVTSFILWPLCNLSSLAALAPFSILGVISSTVVTCFVAWRCPTFVSSSPYAASTGRFLPTLSPHLQPNFCTYNRWCSPAPLVLIAMACVAWMAHFSAPEFYYSLGKRSTPVEKGEDNPETSNKQQQLRQYSIMTGIGYTAVAILNGMLLSAGFLTFGGHSQGIILNNYAVADVGATISRFLVAVSVIGGYPFLFSASRSAALSLFDRPSPAKEPSESSSSAPTADGSSSSKSQLPMRSILMGLITATALLIRNAGFVVSLNGAIMGTAIIYIFPCLLFLRYFQLPPNTLSLGLRLERWLCRLLIGFGGISAIMGAVAAVLVSYFPHLLQ